MPVRDPTSFAWVTYAWVFGLSLWGGGVNFYNKLRSGKARPWNVLEFIGELATSGFAGIITFYLCQAANIDQLITAALVAISGHMGSRIILVFEDWATKRWGGK